MVRPDTKSFLSIKLGFEGEGAVRIQHWDVLMPLFRPLDHRYRIRTLFESELGVIPRSPGSNIFSRSLPVPQQMLRQGVWTVESNRAKSARPSCLYSRRNTCGNSVKKLDITLSLDEVTNHAKKKDRGRYHYYSVDDRP